jgi:hypothetical protein
MSKELNEKLYIAITEKYINYDEIKRLLVEGADPLGPLMDEDETAIGELFCEAGWDWHNDAASDDNLPEDCLCGRLPKILDVFIENGFDCSRFQTSDDGDKNLELWSLTFSISEGECKAMQIMIENGLPIPALEDFIGHFYMDSEMCDGSDMTDEYEMYLVWGFKTIMLCASYPHILNGSEYLRQCIERDSTNEGNNYDLTNFREYNNYEYEFDLSTLDNIPYGMRNATVLVKEKCTGKQVWKMHI